MKFQEILELIDKVAERGIASVEVEQSGTKVRIEGKTAGPQVLHNYTQSEGPVLPSMPIASVPAAAASPVAAAAAPAAAAIDPNAHVITSPIVGTFYRSSNPESQPFVNVGDRVTKGQVLCIIEAMKLMNEIESDHDGVVTEIYPQNGQPVEYGEPLFAIKV